MDLRREKDIEQLRRVALAQQVQIEQLLRVLRSQATELGALKGNDQELQQKLALVEEMARRAQKEVADLEAPRAPQMTLRIRTSRRRNASRATNSETPHSPRSRSSKPSSSSMPPTRRAPNAAASSRR